MPALADINEVFIGRADSLRQLEAALTTALAGRTTAVLIEGAQGVGKTALIERFARSFPDLPALRAGGEEAERAVPCGVVHRVLHRLGAVAPFEAASAGVTLLEALVAGPRPMLIIDDVQWADPESLDAIVFALRRL